MKIILDKAVAPFSTAMDIRLIGYLIDGYLEDTAPDTCLDNE